MLHYIGYYLEESIRTSKYDLLNSTCCFCGTGTLLLCEFGNLACLVKLLIDLLLLWVTEYVGRNLTDYIIL